ncbi:hypothetical protein DFH06DRAFT_1443010 [Mycena polygramma]|nr:hypothetical protein DFH06DRAFT_1443010 [Mycena polygramma]
MLSLARASRRLGVRSFVAASPQPSSQAQVEKMRRDKLEAIYQVFKTMEKGTPEYTKLALSGRVWEGYARPGNIAEFFRVQDGLQDLLRDVDQLREQAVRRKPLSSMAVTLVPAVAQQSVALENNPLTLGESVVVRDRLLSKINLPFEKTLQALESVSLPPPEELLPDKDPDAVAELRNQLFLSQYLAANATHIASLPSFAQPRDLRDIQRVLSLVLRGTMGEKLYSGGWGPKRSLGEFRGMPIREPAHASPTMTLP